MAPAKKKGAKGARRAGAAPTFHLPLHETDALIAMAAGVLESPQLSVFADSRELECWANAVPAGVVNGLEQRAGFGGVLIFRVTPASGAVQFRHGRTYVRLPLAMSRVVAIYAKSADYLAMLTARVEDFPDVVLGVTPMTVENSVFEEAPAAQLFDGDAATQEFQQTTRQAALEAKVAGAAAGLLAGLLAAGPARLPELGCAWEAISFAVDDRKPSRIVTRIGAALSLDAPDRPTIRFVECLVERLTALSTKTGFEPVKLLADVVAEAQGELAEEEASVLRLFQKSAEAVIRLAPGSQKDLLLDGGSVMLRGALAFLRTPSFERLETLIGKRDRIGTRVGLFALTLSGFFTGVAALDRRVKAEPPDRLLGLGELAEAWGTRSAISATLERVAHPDGGLEWAAGLQGRTVASIREPASATELLLRKIAAERGWSVAPAPRGLAIHGDGLALGAVNAVEVTDGPLEPPEPRLAMSITGSLPGAKPLPMLEAIGEAANASGLAVALYKEGKTRRFALRVYLEAEPAAADVIAAVGRLSIASEQVHAAMGPQPKSRARGRVDSSPALDSSATSRSSEDGDG